MNRKVAILGTIATMVMLFASSVLAASTSMEAALNTYGGPIYSGAPNLAATAALLKAGGGAEHFTIQAALVSMLGEKAVNGEVAKLTKQYGKQKVNDFFKGFNFAVHDSIKSGTVAGKELPTAPADLHGVKLAKALVSAGTAPDHVFWSGLILDHALSHDVHNQVMADIDIKYGGPFDKNLHAITNQAMYDVAQALGMKDVKLASLH